ncbi:apolipoprotein N-acyltransferase [Ramlibacter cellulosilyticus]|uniref:apolipoprotein N-acyltransferase n=1 Tax=Ramlibacter cellulosilyticus TaxID=2764187 RepID=UPI00338F30D7
MLVFLLARGGVAWLLAFVALVPWLRTQDAQRSVAGALLGAWGMAVAYTAAAFAWFGSAIGSYTQVGTVAGTAIVLLAAPLLQPQFLAFALVRHAVGAQRPVLRVLAAAAAWAATEWLVPRLLGDTFGYVLYPARLLRQAADLVGVAGLTVLLLLANEAVAAAVARRRAGVRTVAVPLGLAALVPLLLAGYGLAVLATLPAAGERVRVGLVQSNIVDYERLRREKGAGAVVREVLDTHYAMSYDAVERQHAGAVLWSETVYPTTFGHPKSEAGAALDREILQIVDAAGVPFVFGTYDRDAQGEYNAAAFVAPGAGLVGFYRKARPFPLTEYVPPWLDGPALRQWLPWAGSWQPGAGPRVLPLRLKDGREVPVLPLICLDDVDTGLALAGARLGAQAILTLSNDSWFSAQPLGAQLHLHAAAFRSIETRLPQFRVTTNGYSAVIDATGSVVAGSRMGERTLVVGDLPVHEAPWTLMLAWGDWIGPVAAVFLALLGAGAAWSRWGRPRARPVVAPAQPLPREVVVLPPAARLVAGLLRTFARGNLLWMAAAVVLGHGDWHANTLAQIRSFVALFLAPEVAAWLVLRAFTAGVAIEDGRLVLARGRQRLQLALREIVGVEPWRVPVPLAGAWLQLASGQRWGYGIAGADADVLARELGGGGASLRAPPASPWTAYRLARLSVRRGRLHHPVAKFVLLPFVLAIPAFTLHQHIAYGSAFGEIQSFGFAAYLKGFALWWAAWAMGVVLCAAVLRAIVEALTLAASVARPAAAAPLRQWAEGLALAALYLGLPAWLLLLT